MVGLYQYLGRLQSIQVLPYSEFLVQLERRNVRELSVYPDHMEGVLGSAGTLASQRFLTMRVEPALAGELSRSGVQFSGMVQSSFWRDVMSWVLPTLIFVGIWALVMRRMGAQGGLGGGLLSIGKSRARVFLESDTQVTFDDVAGVDEAKEELHEIVDFLKDPTAYGRLGARIPRGILLVGPPGTGKTLLARAVAGQAGVPFFSINGSEFVEMFVGVGAARVRDLFEQARAQAPAIIFIDEIDALGRARGAYGLGGHDEKEQTLNQLLAELDGFDTSAGLVLLAATNRPEILDPALLRAGRFDRQVLVDRPDKRGRVQILNVHLKRIKLLDGGVDPEQVAALTPGFSGADLANLVNEAALMATRRQATSVTLADFTLAMERIVAGLEKRNRVLNPQERRTIATHEMGHALVALSLPGMDTVHKVSIIPRGIGALGYTIQRPTEDRYLMTQEELEHKMTMLLGGRAAEMLLLGHASTGAADDLARATDIARSMVVRFGMDTTLGLVALESQAPTVLTPLPEGVQLTGTHAQYSPQTAREIDCAVRRRVEAAFLQASELLRARQSTLVEGSRLLLERETLVEVEIRALMQLPQTGPLADAQMPLPLAVP
jgi:cell division protease FtsH